MMTDSDNGNGRVTLAVLGSQVDALQKQLQALTTAIERNNQLSAAVAVLDTRVKNTEDDVNNLEDRVNTWSLLNSLGAVGAAVIGVLFGPRQ